MKTNQLTLLDVSHCTQLNYLHCEGQLTSLNLTACTQLETLYCQRNQFTSLDFSKNNMLQFVDWNKNPIIENQTALVAAAQSLTDRNGEIVGRVIVLDPTSVNSIKDILKAKNWILTTNVAA